MQLQQRLLEPPPPEPPPQSRHPAVQIAVDQARTLGQAALAANNPTADPPNIPHWFNVPRATAAWLPLLKPASAILYIHLWALTDKFLGGKPNAWFWRTDHTIINGDPPHAKTIYPGTGLSANSLRRARAELRSAGIAYITTKCREKRPTWYLLRWPPPMPRTDNMAALVAVARALQAGGQPLAAPAAWERLAVAQVTSQHAPQRVAALARRVVQSDASPRSHGLPGLLEQLQEVNPWLAQQWQDWGAGDSPRSSAPTRPPASGATCPSSTPAIAQPST